MVISITTPHKVIAITLRYWQDSNEDGHLDAGELLSINHSIRQADYVFYVAGNAQIATNQPNESTYTSEPAVFQFY
jgi:hypothetical protein